MIDTNNLSITTNSLFLFVFELLLALDPAAPCFETFGKFCFNGNYRALSKNDAEFTQVIHTGSELFGMKRSIGHVDVFVNGGSGQPVKSCFSH